MPALILNFIRKLGKRVYSTNLRRKAADCELKGKCKGSRTECGELLTEAIIFELSEDWCKTGSYKECCIMGCLRFNARFAFLESYFPRTGV